MLQIGKTAQNAIAIISYLAECYCNEAGPVSSKQAGEARNISKALTAKILTTLSSFGFVTGAKGPGGGYSLAKAPETITLMDVVRCFELQNYEMMCPIGEGWCGNNEPCPLHDQIQEIRVKTEEFLCESNFGGFTSNGPSPSASS